MICKYMEQNVLFPKGFELDTVSLLGLSVASSVIEIYDRDCWLNTDLEAMLGSGGVFVELLWRILTWWRSQSRHLGGKGRVLLKVSC